MELTNVEKDKIPKRQRQGTQKIYVLLFQAQESDKTENGKLEI